VAPIDPVQELTVALEEHAEAPVDLGAPPAGLMSAPRSVAIAITGTKWSGRIFFGLPPVRSIKKGKRHA